MHGLFLVRQQYSRQLVYRGGLMVGRGWEGGRSHLGRAANPQRGTALFIGSLECVAGHHGGEKRAGVVLLEHCIVYGFFIKMPLKVN